MTVGHTLHDMPLDMTMPTDGRVVPCRRSDSSCLFFGLLASGMPIFLVLGTCAAVLFYVSGQPLIGVAQVVIDQLNSSTLMALPLFVMAAAFMRQGGVARALVNV